MLLQTGHATLVHSHRQADFRNTYVHVRLGSGQGSEATVVVDDMPPHEFELVEHRPCQGDAVLGLDRVDLASHLDEALVQQLPVHEQLALRLLDMAT